MPALRKAMTTAPSIERRGRIGTLAGQPQAWSVFLQGRRRRRAAPDAPPPVVFTVPAPTAFWRMEEASGTRFDSVGGRHLTDVNTVGQAAGRTGNAAAFDRNNWESLETPDDLALRPENGSFSISAWIYLNGALAENYAVLSKFHEAFGSGNPDREYALFINMTGHGFSPNHPVIRLVMGDENGNDYDQTGQTEVTTDAWHHVGITFDRAADTLSFFLDGVLDATFTGVPQLQDGTFQLMVGRTDQDQAFFHGRLDAIGWFKGIVLTPTHIAELAGGAEYHGGAWH
jgi:hypothetical protein